MTTKKTKESISDNNKDGIAYQCLLKNELLGAGIEDMKEHTEERKIFLPLESKNLFRVSLSVLSVHVVYGPNVARLPVSGAGERQSQ